MTEKPRNHHYHPVESNNTIEITSWGGEWIYIQDLADEQGIMLLLCEVDDVIAALQAAKEAQEKPDLERQERQRLYAWNKQIAAGYEPKG